MAAPPAHATDRVSGAYTTYIGYQQSSQFMRWNQPDRKVRLWVSFDGNANGTGDRCQDAFIDWDTNGTGHYDARVVRNCNPGNFVETDPGGNGFWQEPDDWDEADVQRVQKVGSYVFEDGNLSNIVNDNFLYGSGPDPALATSNFAQRIRTLYDNGDIASFEHLPVRCAGDDIWVGVPGGSGGTCV